MEKTWSEIEATRLPALRARTDEAERLERLVARAGGCVAEGALTLEHADFALARAAEAAAVCDVLLYLAQLCEGGGAEVVREPDALDTFLMLAAQGEYPARCLKRRPEDLSYLAAARRKHLRRGLSSLRGELHGRIEADVEQGVSREEATFATLRHLKQRESLRIYASEVEQSQSVRQTTAEIAELAEACLDVAVTQGAEALGRAEIADHFCVLGMGKLGGRELNFSSDVDLIYLCSDRVGNDADLKSALDALARWVTRAMGSVTADGYVFRVDLRLRPEGSRGSLVHSAAAMVDYYLNWGRTWERSALIKARPVAGSRALGDELIADLEPFIYRRYLDFDVLDELRSMKEQIERNAQVSAVMGMREELADPSGPPAEPSSSLKDRLRQKMRRAGVGTPSRGRPGRARPARSTGLARSSSEADSPEAAPAASRPEQTASPLGWDVKLGVGGIREIEFFVQALQLVHCGTRPALRVRRTLDALDRLLYTGLISHDDHAVLSDAYDLFRRVEHRVQMEHDRQSHRLPAERAGFERLARRMYTDPERLKEELTSSRKRVATMFERLFNESAQTPKEPTVRESRPSELTTVLGAPAERLFDEAVLDALGELGFGRPRQVAGQLQVLREKRYGPFGRHAGTDQRQLSAYILQACASAPDASQAFSYWSRLSTLVGDRPGFYKMLFESPHATRLLLHLFGSSDFLASIVMGQPSVIDYLLGANTVAIVRERGQMRRELDRRLDAVVDRSRRLGRVRRFHQEEVLRIALHEVAGACDISQTVRQLSMLAEVVIEAVLAEVYANLCESLEASEASPPGVDRLPFCVLAMGKLGGRELTFGSDLDVIFVYEPDAERGLDSHFFSRLAQRLVRNLSSVSAEGKLYEVDTRLRPSGRQGTLVVSLDAFGDYHRQRADLWERQAMLRARPVTGPPDLRRSLMQLRAEIAFGQPPPADLGAQIGQMRDKMVEHLGPSRDGLDIKTGEGAMIDVEFLTQYLQLAYASEADGLEDASAAERGAEVVGGARSQNTFRALAGLCEAVDVEQLEAQVDCLQLVDDYRMLRRVEARLRMSDQRATGKLPTGDKLHTLARRLGYQGAGAAAQLSAEIEAINERVAGMFEAIRQRRALTSTGRSD